MSTVQASERTYHAVPCGSRVFPWQVIGGPSTIGSPAVAVDMFRTRSGAEYAARLLNERGARIDPHATLGCRVVF